MKKLERVDKILSNLGYTSRRKVNVFLKNNSVTINNTRIINGTQKALPHSILINNIPLDHPDGILIMLNKPAGFVCSHDANEGPRVYDLLPPQWMSRNPVPSTIGRLDKNTTGLILITDITKLVHFLSSPTNHFDKCYIATVDKPLSTTTIDFFASGKLHLKNEKKTCLPAKLDLLNSTTARISLQEGKYHQVRRMFSAAGYMVTSLHREKFGKWELGNLCEGTWKDCTL